MKLGKVIVKLLCTMLFIINLHAVEDTSREQFIERLYQNVLQRESDDGGLNYWLNQLQNTSGANVAAGFFNSPEFQNLNLDNQAYLARLYTTLFDREGDTSGMVDWLTRINDGLPRERIMHGFFNSQEFSNLADSFGVTAIRDEDQLVGVDDFVERFYNLVLGRSADVAGLNDWVSQLNSGTRSGEDIANGFFNSQEYLNRNDSNEDFINTLYQAFFNRAADQGGFDGWIAELNNGATRQNIIDGFSNSQEFINLANEFGISATLETGNLLGNIQEYSTRTPLAGITINLFDTSNNLVQSTVSNTDGNYVIEGLIERDYNIQFSSPNYLDGNGSFRVLANANNVFSQILMPLSSSESTQGSISGNVLNGLTGLGLNNITLTLYQGLNITSGTPLSTVSSTNSGSYQFDGLSAGYYTIVASGTDYSTASYPLTIGGNNTTQSLDITITPALGEKEARVVLTWGETPSDLDSHLAYVEYNARKFHVYYSNQNPFNANANLDTDDVSSFGPETVTITDLSFNGDYKYYVHDYSTYTDVSSMVLANSNAKVTLYYANNVYEYNVPNYPGTIWKVFEIKNGVLTPCNQGSGCVFNVESNTYDYVEDSDQFGIRNNVRHTTIKNSEFELFKNLETK